MSDKSEVFENSEDRLIRLLKENPQSSEARQALENWTIDQEQQVENVPLAAIEFNLRRARLYFAAGHKDAALENFEAAREQAWNEQNQKLYAAIMEEMDRLEI